MSNQPTPDQENNQTTRTITEELEMAGSQLLERVQEIIRQGNVRRVIIRTADNRVLMDTTLTLGAVAGAMALVYWPLAAVAAIAAAVARVKVEIVREVVDAEADIPGAKARIEITGDDES
jgi:hypothetical protein